MEGAQRRKQKGNSALCAGKEQVAESRQVQSRRGLGEQVAQTRRRTGRAPAAHTSGNGWSFLEYGNTFSLVGKQQLLQSPYSNFLPAGEPNSTHWLPSSPQIKILKIGPPAEHEAPETLLRKCQAGPGTAHAVLLARYSDITDVF